MTTIELRAHNYETENIAWSNTEVVESNKSNGMFSKFGSWVTGIVYGYEAPTIATYERFSGQESQVPRFLDQHSFSISDNIVLGEE